MAFGVGVDCSAVGVAEQARIDVRVQTGERIEVNVWNRIVLTAFYQGFAVIIEGLSVLVRVFRIDAAPVSFLHALDRNEDDDVLVLIFIQQGPEHLVKAITESFVRFI